ncbi:MAG: AraC family transcriptional regulator [Lachnospiraceae bacterium]|nr:AraC family transcriptional regulator [Lachnospiraceae bacterium]
MEEKKKKETKLVYSTSDMQEVLDSCASSINVHNGESDFSRFYHMNVPFQLTLEYCGGADPEDYVNVVTISFEKAVLYQESQAMKNYSYTKNAPHFHDFFEFVIVLSGTVTQKIEGKECLYPAGSCCLINRNLRHMERYSSQCSVLFIGLSPDFVTALFDSAQNALFADEKKIYNSVLYDFITTDLTHPGERAYLDFIPSCQNRLPAARLHSIAESMIQTLLFPSFGSTCQICGQLCALLTLLSSPNDYHCTNIRLDTNSDFLIFSRITRLFEESDGRMTRTELEQLLHYSGDYLNRIVNKFTDMCLYDYGLTFCMKKAAQYLTETDESISAIAAKLRFTNRTHFYALFKENYGVTPMEYRKMHS